MGVSLWEASCFWLASWDLTCSPPRVASSPACCRACWVICCPCCLTCSLTSPLWTLPPGSLSTVLLLSVVSNLSTVRRIPANPLQHVQDEVGEDGQAHAQDHADENPEQAPTGNPYHLDPPPSYGLPPFPALAPRHGRGPGSKNPGPRPCQSMPRVLVVLG